MKRTLFFLLTFILLCSSKCKEDPTPAPDPKPYINKFNCKINGKYWEVIPKELHLRPNQSNTLMVTFWVIKNDTLLQIWADNEPDLSSIHMLIPLFPNNNLSYNSHPSAYSESISNGCSLYRRDTLKTNKVELITYDKKDKIIKGAFNFTTIGSNCNDTIRVTDGFFDINY